ncbi:aminoglycoside phosphotransferase family protein [Nonomuraea soli]|uniref:Streptomycin 6-kinase n=1 Tax=Nonomuraea soli TaxID=1032476 RepID=A0A7W0CFY4_9ACTN|nr:aminoglycoside phosphotransferase family protein [Nonomuraea soli]MBA2890473.1 streptomycin 6-kinase [Nonomuraea soli]
MIEIPERFARGTVEREGEAGAAWLAGLPAIVEDLLERWGCERDGRVVHGGVGVIVPVSRASRRAVLKVSFPHPGNVHEPDAFAAWDGRGAVRLHERDDARFAMLLERASSTTLRENPDTDEVMTVAGRISRRLAVAAPPALPRLAERADEWEERLGKDAAELEHTMPRRVVDAARATARELGRDQPGTLIHGDLHAGNILRAEREPWLAVDPKGYAGDPAYDAGALLKGQALAFVAAGDPAKAMRRAMGVFADAAGLDPARVRRWVQFHAVQAAFHGRRHGFNELREGPEMRGLMELADRFAEMLAET